MKNKMDKTRLPVGIFDSGIGGLTVLKEIRKLLPNENLIYFGDTARVPYGTKSKEVVRKYAVQISDFLKNKNVKMMVAACNTVSSTAMGVLKKRYGIPLVGVVEPGSKEAVLKTKTGRVAVIGTEATIKSGAYQKMISRFSKEKVKSYARSCPLFVPLVEEGWVDNRPACETAKIYLGGLKLTGADTLILGCTHYPLLKKLIRKAAGPEIMIIDSASATAKAVAEKLAGKNIRNNSKQQGHIICYVTDSRLKFGVSAEKILGYPLSDIRVVKFN
ncbi:MAG TPA: glutamate racemase [Firmicutes bacterium]|nr:glutamate racemase [Bacillota bacterium]